MAAANGRPRHDSTLARLALLALAAASSLAACAADGDSRKRSGPPGGGVDPAGITSDNLAMGGGATPGPERIGDPPSTADPTTGAVDVPSPSTPSPLPQMGSTQPPPAGLPTPSPQPTNPSPVPAGSAKPGATTFKMTAAHCATLGRKFGQLTIAVGGDQADANRVGNDFAAKCTRDQVGQVTEQREFDCILALKAITDLPSCK
jgi:hypothetical protein